ncbi:MAG: hypothetical protein EOO46_20335 [Flavobacterium sp.]|nr:MAG: hypothetical protein EOO46_20335 [Flavobacterium sp.]
MKRLVIIAFLLAAASSFGQSKIEKLTKPIIEEGKKLYKSEMASSYGSDIFLEKYKEREKIGGYFSYTENATSKCIFFSKGEQPKVIGTMSFDDTFNLRTAKAELSERDFTELEFELYTLRTKAMQALNSDTIFKQYKKTNLNLVPLISNGEKKVYVLTAPKEVNVMIFGNDYLLKFDNGNNLVSRQRIHQDIIWTETDPKVGDSKQVVGGTHTHLPETGDLITPTDICTLMLYEKLTSWEVYYIYSKEYVCIWNCDDDELTAIPIKKNREKQN